MCCFSIFLLCADIVADMFGRHEYDTFTLDLLKTFFRSDLLKCLSIRCRNCLATLVDTFSLYGGLNHVTPRFLFLVLLSLIARFEYSNLVL